MQVDCNNMIKASLLWMANREGLDKVRLQIQYRVGSHGLFVCDEHEYHQLKLACPILCTEEYAFCMGLRGQRVPCRLV